MTKNSKMIVIVISLIVLIGGTFYGGMKYGQSKSTGSTNQQTFGNFASRGGNPNGAGRGAGANMRGGMENGEILAKDEQSITIKLRDGGSKIIFLSEKTEITKSEAGTADDLVVGKTVFVGGTANPDGSVNATSIQLR